MTSNLLITLAVWAAVGWTMLHVVWVGAVIALMAALARRLLKSARPETRYSVALMFLLALAVSPVAIFVRTFKPGSVPPVTMIRSTAGAPASLASFTSSEHRPTTRQASREVVFERGVGGSARLPLDSLVMLLPWIWLFGSLSTQVLLAAGLIGVEQLRRSSRPVESGDIPRRCRALADSLGIARRVSVGICDRLAIPVLIGIVRPLILLPPAAHDGWSVEQLEMVLLHELAHARRWDNLVNLLQRFVESLLFFHPVVWWLSGWVRLERELCCDRLVVERLGQPVAYAEMLVALAGTSHRERGAVLAMADRQVLTRIRRLLNLEERSMRLTMPEGLGLFGAVVVAISLALGLPAAQLSPVSDSSESPKQVKETAVDDIREKPPMNARPTPTRLPKRAEPSNPRAITIFSRDERQLQIVQLPTTSDGVTTYRCRGGIEIVCNSHKFGTVRMEADEAVIKRVNPEEPFKLPHGETWLEEAYLPMEVHLKGDVVLSLRIAGKVGEQTVRAAQLDYDFVTGRVVGAPAESEVTDPELDKPNEHNIKLVPDDAPKGVPVPGTLPPQVIAEDTGSAIGLSASRQPASVPPSGQRTTSLLPRGARRLQITHLPRTLEGVVKYVCRGGIRIVTKSTAFGTVSMEADEAVIARNPHRRNGEIQAGSTGETWVEEDELPMEAHLKGDVIFRQDQGKIAGKGDEQTVRASQLDYDFVTKRLVATDAEIVALSASGLPTSTLSASRIELSLVRTPDGSLTPVEHRDIRAGHQSSTEDSVIETVTPPDLKPSEP